MGRPVAFDTASGPARPCNSWPLDAGKGRRAWAQVRGAAVERAALYGPDPGPGRGPRRLLRAPPPLHRLEGGRWASAKAGEGGGSVEIGAAEGLRGWVVQPRLATREGFIIGHLTGGAFLWDEAWQRYGSLCSEPPDCHQQSVGC